MPKVVDIFFKHGIGAKADERLATFDALASLVASGTLTPTAVMKGYVGRGAVAHGPAR